MKWGIPVSKIKMNTSMLDDYTSGRKNNLDVIRLGAALMVIFSHAFGLAINWVPKVPFYKGIDNGLGFRDNNFALLGLQIFFIVSGFLITKSYMDNRDPVRFLWARFLRIFPALICVILITTFVIGPLFTVHPLVIYLTSGPTYSYLSNITLYGYTASLPGVFNNTALNVPLWTLKYEFTFYFVTLFLGILTLLSRRRIVLGLFITSLVLSYLKISLSNIQSQTTIVLTVFWLFTYFGAGMVAYLYREYIPIDARLFLFAVVILIISSLGSGLEDNLLVFFLTYIVLFIAYSPRVKLSYLTKYGDFSYGMYIWAFPLQKIVVSLVGTPINPWLMVLISFCMAFVLGGLSWHLVEKRMLKLKSVDIRQILNPKRFFFIRR
ncbi:MAG: acyltransferase [Dehalococcoidia bacterium]|jgi:peptidoglycan/LPS O-acetylase OafA/YrhL